MATKFCKDCVHVHMEYPEPFANRLNSIYRCKKAPKPADLVTGYVEYRLCSDLRDPEALRQCGPTGQWFEPRDGVRVLADTTIAHHPV